MLTVEFCTSINFEVKNCTCIACSLGSQCCLLGKPSSCEYSISFQPFPHGIDENLACLALGCLLLFLNKDQLAGVLSQERLRCSVVCWQDLKMGKSGAPGGDTSCGVDEAQAVKPVHSGQVDLSGSGFHFVG